MYLGLHFYVRLHPELTKTGGPPNVRGTGFSLLFCQA
jgi:hypothetical protein